MSNAKEILGEAISLSPKDRIYLIDGLVSSLDKPDKEISELWADEAERRIEAYERGELKSVSIEKVMEKYK